MNYKAVKCIEATLLICIYLTAVYFHHALSFETCILHLFLFPGSTLLVRVDSGELQQNRVGWEQAVLYHTVPRPDTNTRHPPPHLSNTLALVFVFCSTQYVEVEQNKTNLNFH